MNKNDANNFILLDQGINLPLSIYLKNNLIIKQKNKINMFICIKNFYVIGLHCHTIQYL